MKLLYSSLLLFFCYSISAQDISSMVDSRDGQTYKTIDFEIPLEGGIFIKRMWMGENLKYDPGENTFCYKDEPAYCGKFGRLYTFDAAAKACPEGWRIPTTNDWMLLFSSFGGLHSAGTSLVEEGGSGMELLLGGFGDASGFYNGISIEGNYWDSEEISGNSAGVITFHRGSAEVFHSRIGKSHRNSCRCIKDY